MENRSAAIAAIVAFLFVTACIGSSSAQAPAPGPSSTEDECMAKVLNMSDCLSYVAVGSNVTVPDKACCPELAGLVESDPLCLCQLLGKSDTFGFNIDVSRALKLPSVCRVTTPSVTLCSVVGIPVGAPSASQGAPSPGVQPPGGNNDSAALGNSGSVLASLVGLAFAFLI